MPNWYNPSRQKFQPKRKFRFVVEFPNFESETTYMVTKCKKPSFDMQGDTEHRVLNHSFKFPGIIKWNDIELSFIDALDPNVGSKFYSVLKNMGYVNPTRLENLHAGITKTSAQAALGEIRILHLDAGAPIVSGFTDGENPNPGDVLPTSVKWIEEWKLHNAYIKSVAWGDLAYDSDEIITIDLGITYDWATFTSAGAEGQTYPIQG